MEGFLWSTSIYLVLRFEIRVECFSLRWFKSQWKNLHSNTLRSTAKFPLGGLSTFNIEPQRQRIDYVLYVKATLVLRVNLLFHSRLTVLRNLLRFILCYRFIHCFCCHLNCCYCLSIALPPICSIYLWYLVFHVLFIFFKALISILVYNNITTTVNHLISIIYNLRMTGAGVR